MVNEKEKQSVEKITCGNVLSDTEKCASGFADKNFDQ